MGFEPRKLEVTASEALARHFADAAAFLRRTGSAAAFETLDGVIGTSRPTACSASRW